ncbi:ATP-binding protein [Sporomusa acidovorans]|nr:ATP-binding protein [Sporomusa acidovorans]
MVLFNFEILPWKYSLPAYLICHLLYLACGLLFVWSTCLLIGKPLRRYWWNATFLVFLLDALFSFARLHYLFTMVTGALFFGSALLWVGSVFIRHLQANRVGHCIVGCAFILWGIITIIRPCIVQVPTLLFWSNIITGILRPLIAAGMLAIYFEKARLELIHKEAQYRLLAENAIDIIYRYKVLPRARFEYVSPAVLSVTGYTPAEFYANAKLIFKLIHPNDLSLFSCYIANPFQRNDLPLTLRLIRKDGKVIWFEQKCVPVYDKSGNLEAVEGIIRDVTVRKELEQVVSRVECMNMVGEMAANVAHEIRNPMTTVRGYLQMLEKKQPCPACKERFAIMIEELDRANTIISEYLTLAKDKRADLKNCSLNRIVTSLFPLMQAHAAASNSHIELELTDVPELFLDENEIRQLILNLVHNGLEAMPEGGNLTIGTLHNRDVVTLSIRDQGHGIPGDIREKLGTPFLSTKDTGTGLGIPICFRIAHRHHAVIGIDTGTNGTTFTINFKLPGQFFREAQTVVNDPTSGNQQLIP